MKKTHTVIAVSYTHLDVYKRQSVDIPREWEEALIVPIFKKGNARDCNNYRGINLLNTIVKVYEQIINNTHTLINSDKYKQN